MHKEFIEKTKKMEEEFLNGEIKMNDYLDWCKLKNSLWNLGELWANEENKNISQEEKTPITLENCKNFTRKTYQTMRKMEQKYKNNFDKFLTTMYYQLRFLALYHRLSSYRKELEENYLLEKKTNENIPYVDKKDIFGKTYRIKESNKEYFEASCLMQKEMYKEYRQIYTCIYKDINEQIKLMGEYNKEAKEFMSRIVDKKIEVTSLEQWTTFKENINNFKMIFDALITNIVEIENIKLGENQYKKFIDLLAEVIQKIEERYAGNISKDDLLLIMENIWVISKYQALTLEIMHVHTIKTSEEDQQMKKIEINRSLQLSPAQTEIYHKLVEEQNKLKARYEEAKQFVFGTEPTRDKAM